MPEGWQETTMGQGVELISGQHIEASFCNDYGLGSPYLTGPADFPENRIIVTKYTEQPKVMCRDGDVLLTVKGSGTGKSILADSAYCISRQLMAVRPRDYDAGFIFYVLKNNEDVYGGKSTGLIPGITRDDVLKTPVCIPPLEEQRKIAEILSAWDEAIEQQTRLLELKRERKRGLMQQLLTGRVRFKEFTGLEWKSCRFGDVFKRITRKNSIGNTNALTISGTLGLVSQTEFFNKRIASNDVGGYYLLKRGEFAYNKSYSNGYPMGAIKRLDRYDQGVLSTLYICFAAKNVEADSDFFMHYFESGLFNWEISQIAQEGARNHGLLNVSTVDFFETSLPLPTLTEQQKIATVLSAADAEIETLTAQLAALKSQKRGMMQRLLTGKTRVQLA